MRFRRQVIEGFVAVLLLIWIALGTCGWFGDYSGRQCYRSAEAQQDCLDYAADRRLSP